MKILVLGPYRQDIISYLRTFDDQVLCQEDRIIEEKIINAKYDFIISYRYRYIIPKSVVEYYKNRIINLHISLLPWNRGADPNLWSFLEDTPKGVTIHYINEGLDKGDIIAQKEVFFSDVETLRTSYDRLTKEIEILFKKVWPDIREGKNSRYLQKGKGTYHRLKDKEKFMHLLYDGWNTPVKHIIGIAKRGE